MIAWTALTLTPVRHGYIPAWFLVVHGLRWGLPLALGFGRTFATARPMRLNRSRVGRVAGASQALLAAAVLLSYSSMRNQGLCAHSVHNNLPVLENNDVLPESRQCTIHQARSLRRSYDVQDHFCPYLLETYPGTYHTVEAAEAS